ncbi:MAG: glycosyltransferase [Cyanobacteria bacterium RI_101]|nr:glycosyltransferase [Cyanobacteria bacterium RI_101]
MQYQIKHAKDSVTFSPGKILARVLMVPFATDAELVETVLNLKENQHHAWGVKELLAANIEVTVTRRYRPRWERFGQDWLIPNPNEYDLIYSNHNRLVRTPLSAQLGLTRTPFVSLVYAGEPLLAAKSHFGLLCMTPRAFSRFQSLPATRVHYAPWGIDPESALHQPLEPTGDHHISTGVTKRDFTTLLSAAKQVEYPIVIAARGQRFGNVPANVRVIQENVSPWDIRNLYQGACSGLIILERDDQKRLAVGWTNMLELMAMGIPIIKTRTGSLDDIVDLEKIGAGILVEPENPAALSAALLTLQENPELRRAMGQAGADYVRAHLTMRQFAKPLIELVFQAQTKT